MRSNFLYVRLIFIFFLSCLSHQYVNAQNINAITYPLTFKRDTSVKLEPMADADTILGAYADSIPSLLYTFPDSFIFYFVGTPYSGFSASPDGWLSLGKEGQYVSKNSLLDTTNQTILAPFWHNLSLGEFGAVTYKITGSTPNRKVVIDWSFYNQYNTSYMQVWLWENGKIEYVYSPSPSGYYASAGIANRVGNKRQICSINPDVFWNKIDTLYSTEKEILISKQNLGKTRITFTPYSKKPDKATSLFVKDIGATSLSLNWTDSSASETFFQIGISSDNLNFSQLATVVSNTTGSIGSRYNFNIPNLLPGTKYYFSITPANEGGAPGSSLIISGTTLPASLKGLKKIPGDYSTITDALTSIRKDALSGNLILELQKDYVSVNEKFPLEFDESLLTSAGKSITIRTASNASFLKISGNNDNATIILNNASHIFFDGGKGSNDTSRNLEISNTSYSGNAIKFNNGASYDTIRNCVLRATANYKVPGIVHFGSTNKSYGNNYNTITGCAITAVSSIQPNSSVYSFGSAQAQNKNNVIKANVFYDILRTDFPTQSSIIQVLDGNTGWVIDGNSFCQTATTAQAYEQFYCIKIKNADGEDFKIVNNFIGGSASFCKGKINTINSFNYGSPFFTGISVSLKNMSGRYNIIKGNTINNLSLGSARFIEVNSGYENNLKTQINYDANISVEDNIIGSQDTAHDLKLKYGGIGILAWEFFTAEKISDGKINISKNKIGGIVVGDNNWEGGLVCIQTECKNVNVKDNLIGSRNTKNSIIVNRGDLTGIQSRVFGELSISGNEILNLKQTFESNQFSCIGIEVGLELGYSTNIKQYGTAKIENNIVKSIFSESYYAGGIRCSSENVNFVITENSISDIEITGKRTNYYKYRSNVFGVVSVSNSNNSKSIISRNLVHSLVCKLEDSYISGVLGEGYDVLCVNNIVRLGKDIYGKSSRSLKFYTSQIDGISISSIYNSRIFHNTVYVYGDSLSCGDNIFLLSTSSQKQMNGFDSVCNNLLYLDMPSQKCIKRNGFVSYSSPKNNNYINHNLYYSQGGISPDFRRALSVDEWKRETGNDVNSIFLPPNLKNPGGDILSMDLGMKDSSYCEGDGICLAAVSTDFYGNKRSGLTGADIGAIAGNVIKNKNDVTAPIILISDTLINTASFTNRLIKNVRIIDSGLGVPVTGANVPHIWFRKSSASSGGWQSAKGNLTSGNGHDGLWVFEIDYTNLNISYSAGTKIEYYFVAQDLSKIPNVGFVNGRAATQYKVDSQIATPLNPHHYYILQGISGSVYVGKGETFTSLTNSGGFFNSANNSVLTGDLNVFITSDLSETGTYSLNYIVCEDTNKYTITIKPYTGSVKTILGTSWNLLSFVNSERIIIDGSFNGNGQHLKFRKKSAWGNDINIQGVNHFTLKNCVIEAPFWGSGFQFLPDNHKRNNNIFIQYNSFRNRADTTELPYYMIAAGDDFTKINNVFTDTATYEITGNNFSNYTLSAIKIDSIYNKTSWKISQNNLFNTVAITLPYFVDNHHIPINFRPGESENGSEISGNYIGGQAAKCKGKSYANTGWYSNFTGIYCKAGNQVPTKIDDNVIRNIDWKAKEFYDFAEIEYGGWNGIYVVKGKVSLNHDTIGNELDTNSIKISIPSFTGYNFGIIDRSADSISINGCSISSIYAKGTATNSITAIACYNGINTVFENKIGGDSSAYSILSRGKGYTNSAQNIIGIHIGKSDFSEVRQNVISNLINYSYANDSDITAAIVTNSSSLISGNIINNILGALQTESNGVVSANGIFVKQLLPGDSTIVTENQIYAISGVSISGIKIKNKGNSYSRVSRNVIHNFDPSYYGQLIGIHNISGRCLIDNNMVDLGYNSVGASVNSNVGISGIYSQSTGKDEIYYNSIFIGGDSVLTEQVQFLNKQTFNIYVLNGKNDIVWNNILYNARANGKSDSRPLHGTIYVGDMKNLSLQNNLFYSNSIGGFWGTVNSKSIRFESIKSKSDILQLDKNAVQDNPVFVRPKGNAYTVNLHVKDSNYIEGRGTYVKGIDIDFDGDVRQESSPVDIGADAGKFTLMPSPKANFLVYNACVTDTISFIDSSVLAAEWHWNFGDSTFSRNQHPKHKFVSPGIYKVQLIVNNGYGYSDTSIKTVEVYSMPKADFSTREFCLGNSTYFFDSSKAVAKWLWDFNDSTVSTLQNPLHKFTKPGTYNVKLKIWNSNGCTDSTIKSIEIEDKPIAIFSAPNICVTENLTLADSSKNAVSWRWKFGDGSVSTLSSPSYKYLKAGKYNIWLIVSNTSGCKDSVMHTVTVDSTCVWPGDANADKVVDNKDILAIGIAYSDTGSVRTDTSTIWKSNLVKNWNGSFSSGPNYKHADSDGDGIVSNTDTLAITRNYSKTHAKKHKANRRKNTDPVLKIDIQNDSLKAGDTLVAYIVLGENALPAKDVYGLAFSVNYNNDYFSDVDVDFTGNWFGTNTIGYSNKTAGLDLALTKTDQKNTTGSGRLATIRFILKENQELDMDQLNLEIVDNVLISVDEQLIPTNIEDDSVKTYKEPNSILFNISPEGPEIKVYPNPFTKNITLEYESDKVTTITITISDMTGRSVILYNRILCSPGKNHFNLNSELYNRKGGIYLVKIEQNGITSYRKIVKI